MNYPIRTAAVLLAAVTGLAVAQAPEIAEARIDSMVKQLLQAADQNPNQTGNPDGKAIRQEVVKQLQSVEILKNEAIKAGLDKDAEVQARFQNMQAQFYAAEYAHALERDTEVSDAELRRLYDSQTRMIKLQQVSFASAQEARDAQNLLRKGLSFEELMKRHPNPDQKFDSFIMPNQMPQTLAAVIEPLQRGDVTQQPVKLQDKFYLFKLSQVERNPDAQPFELVRNEIARQAKQQKVRRQIDDLLKANGIQP